MMVLVVMESSLRTITSEGNTPSEDLLAVKVSPGKAYVKGYELERLSTTFLDVPKPRTTREVLNEGVSYSTGDPLLINNVFGSPSLGIGTTATISLRSRRKGESGGTEIGLARVYDFQSESDKHQMQQLNELRLFDISFTNVELEQHLHLYQLEIEYKVKEVVLLDM